MHATLSFNGLLEGYPELFDDLKVPDGVSKETVCNQLTVDTLELEVLYADGPAMRRALGVFSETMLPSWTRYAKVLGLDYNPLNTDEHDRTLKHSGNDSHTRTPNLTTTGQNNGSDSTTREVAGFDSAQLQTAEKNTTQLGTGNTITSTGTDTTRGTAEYKDIESYQGRTGKAAQSLVLSEIAVSYENAVAKIVEDIKQKFCLLVY